MTPLFLHSIPNVEVYMNRKPGVHSMHQIEEKHRESWFILTRLYLNMYMYMYICLEGHKIGCSVKYAADSFMANYIEMFWPQVFI